MKLITIALTLAVAAPSFAAGKRPGTSGERDTRGTRVEAISNKVAEFNTFLRDTIQVEKEITTPKDMTEAEQSAFSTKLQELKDAFEVNKSKYVDTPSKLKVEQLIESYNDALTTRSTFKELSNSLKDDAAKAAVKEVIELIDNGPKVIEAKVSESGETLVSEGLIIMTFNSIAKAVNKTNLSATEVLELKRQLEEPFKNERWTLQDIARCR